MADYIKENNKPDKFGSESGSSGTYYFRAFSLRAEDSAYGVFASDIFRPPGIEYKGGRLVLIFS